MKLENLTCNRCGAPLPVAPDANFVTCRHCSSQLAIRRTEDATFTEQLEQIAEKTDRLSERVDRLANQSEVAELDRRWEQQRSELMIQDKHGNRHVPTSYAGVVGGMVIALFGSLWTALVIGITSSAPNFGPFAVARFVFPAFGVIFVLAGIAMSVSQFYRVSRYRKAERQYQIERGEAVGRADTDEDDEDRFA